MDRHATIPQSASLTAPFTQRGLIIGITGGSGSGKTTLLNMLKTQGALVLDCDAIYHRLLETDPDLLQSIKNRFPGCVGQNGLDRKKLGAIVFSDKDALLDLNRITHSAVHQEVRKLLEKKPALTAIDAIGLFEGGLSELCDVTVAVTADEKIRLARLMARDHITEEYAKKRISSQKSPQEFTALCDHILENNGTKEEFENKCLAFFQDLGIMKL